MEINPLGKVCIYIYVHIRSQQSMYIYIYIDCLCGYTYTSLKEILASWLMTTLQFPAKDINSLAQVADAALPRSESDPDQPPPWSSWLGQEFPSAHEGGATANGEFFDDARVVLREQKWRFDRGLMAGFGGIYCNLISWVWIGVQW